MLLELRLKHMREADLSAFQNSIAVANMGQVCLKDLAAVVNNTVSKG